jgi:hypothetical protein
MKVRLSLAVIALIGIGGSLSGHHSAVAYAPQSIVLKNATMMKVVWASPHIILSFTAKEPNGKATSWSVETGSPTSVARLGWNRNSVKAGDVVTVELFPAKNGAHVGRLKKVTFPDGHALLDTQSNPESIKK